ncbi:hypothetical protein KKF91_19435 [Myxococcota bacterium]|nr:hypothetical protein [Myxococcota bacterium]MBU1432719.1 hypothetical protein [Myxococcota bacterium]MBU1899412.1 hypothetical protein [Myxococcota bacterium]
MSATLALLGLLLSPPATINIRGVALTPHYEREASGLLFDRMVDEVADLQATDLSVVVVWSQADVRATRIQPHPKETQDEEVVRRIIRRARGRGLRVTLFPILWIEQRGEGEWRGTLNPSDPAAWWASYGAFILHFAEMAQQERAAIFSVGSELASIEHHERQWRALIGQVRARFSGQLLYSANWDHYAPVKFWDDLDYIGLTAYYRLTDEAEGLPSVAALTTRWLEIKAQLLAFQGEIGRPLLFTEVGYPSLKGAAYSPWDYTGSRPIDLEAQRRCLAAFNAAWIDEPKLAGAFFWNWWGPGGPEDGGYTPKGKPGEAEVRRFIKRAPPGSPPG